MKRLLILLIFVFFCYTVSAGPAFSASGNIFGLHLTQTSDIESVAPIINSNGGNWGWVTIVIRLDQLDRNTWQNFFDKCRQLHLIPIVRLATINENGNWKQPSISDIDNLANFLNKLNWPTLQQHLILFNEINQSQEWGGQVDVKSYTDSAIYAIDKFKSLNPNFYLLSTGLDLAAPKLPPKFESAQSVYQQIYQYKKEYFDKIDAIASHSYPNHGYIGTPQDTGQHSIRGYQWELQALKNLGIARTFPVFITETGWPHQQGESNDNKYYSVDTAVKFLISAFSLWQSDNRITAVTPFIYNYPYSPFDHFSWLDKKEKLYPSYNQITNLPKKSLQPAQLFSFESVNIELPLFMFPNSTYQGKIWLKNSGQSIWGPGEYSFCQKPFASPNITLQSICTTDQLVMPGQIAKFSFSFKLEQNSENSFIGWLHTPAFHIKPVLPMITNAQIYRPENSFIDHLRRFWLNLTKQ